LGFWGDGSPVVPGQPVPGAPAVRPDQQQPQGMPGMATPDPLGWSAPRYPPPGQGPVYPASENPNAFPGQPDVWEQDPSRGILPNYALEGLVKAQLADLQTRGQMLGRPHWFSRPTKLRHWKAPVPPSPGIVARTVISAPTFDLRPDLKALVGDWTEEALPIWNEARFGAGLYLYCQILGNIPGIDVGLKVYSIEKGNIINARDTAVLATQQPQDITTDFYDGALTCILKWSAPGYKIWHVEVRFDQLDGEIGEIGEDLFVQWAIY
jgi:hypothetical protein